MEKYDETWLAHANGFDSVLKQLQQSHSSSSASSLNNMSERVKETKTRFTYKKQSSGKDLSSRSHQELDCIFGWNKTRTERETDNYETSPKQTRNNQYTTSKQSIDEYFKEKSRTRQEKSPRTDETSTKTKKNKRKQKDLEELAKQQITSDDTVVLTNDQQDETTNVDVKRKKKRKTINKDNEETNLDQQTDEIVKEKDLQSEKIGDDSSKDLELLFPGSNLSDLNGYRGWDLDSSLEQILKIKEKKTERTSTKESI